MTNARAKYLVGWSHGKETLRPGVVDTAKGSYYINCSFYKDRRKTEDADVVRAEDGEDDERSWEGFEEYTAPSIWPDEEDIPHFQESAEQLITMIIDVAVLVARACDRYAIEAVEGYREGYLERVVKTSRTTKARLLHYFPAEGKESAMNVDVGDAQETKDNPNEDDWCATHVDHGCLTGLTSAMFVEESTTTSTDRTNLLEELPKSPSPASGLYIRSRAGETVKVNIPKNCLAFQTGEALELITKGKFKAVPHFVRGVRASVAGSIARNTLAVFTQPNLGELVDHDKGVTFGEFARQIVSKNTA